MSADCGTAGQSSVDIDTKTRAEYFAELLGRVKETILGAFIHQDLPLTRILREVQPDRDLGRTPLFTVQFSLLTPDHNPAVYGYGLDTGIAEPVDLPGLTVRPVPVHYDNARYDVAVSAAGKIKTTYTKVTS